MRLIPRTTRLIGWLCCLLLAAQATAERLDARIDRNRLVEGDTLTLNISAPANIAGALDLSALEPDFELLGQSESKSISMSITAGRATANRKWQLVLAPRRAGSLTIPPLQLGNLASEPLAVEVLPADQAAKLGASRPLLLEVEVSPEDPYVQGEVIYTLRVLSRFPLTNANLSEPRIDDAIVERLGEDRQSTTFRDGQQYQVTERRYAFFPQHSGSLEIEAPVLAAQVPEAAREGSGLRQRMFGSDPLSSIQGLYQRMRPVQVLGRKSSIEVRPQPAGTATPWLPARDLALSESWSPEAPEFRVGEPVTRTITITARGLSDAQLPDLPQAVPDGIKSYPDKWQSTKHLDGDVLVARKTGTQVLLPSRAGEMTLPEIRLAWWDSRAGQQKVATLPARTILVQPGAAAEAGEPGGPAAETHARDATAEDAPDTARVPGVDEPEPAEGLARFGRQLLQHSPLAGGHWPLVAGGFAIAWLISTGLWLRARRRLANAGETAEKTGRIAHSPPKPEKSLRLVRKACRTSNPGMTRRKLLEWAAARWPDDPPRTLESLGPRLGGETAALLRELDLVLYAPRDGDWDGKAFWKHVAPALKHAAPMKPEAASNAVLPALYPDGAR